MKKIRYVFQPFFTEITQSFMLVACIAAPVIMGAVFRLGLPVLEKMLCGYFRTPQVLSPYYVAFELLLAVMAPILFCFAGVLVILEELDCGVAKYYSVTPIGKRGYLISRIVIPSIVAFLYDVVLLRVFAVVELTWRMAFLLSCSGTLLAIVSSLFVAAFAKNKMEGMALVKLCGLLVVGIPAAYFVASPIRYAFGILPSFWMAELCITNNYVFFILAAASSGLMILILFRRFQKKLL